MGKAVSIFILLIISLQTLGAQPDSSYCNSGTLSYLNIPERPENAMGGSDFVTRVAGWSITERETALIREVLSGNVPSFSRKLKAVKISQTLDEEPYEFICFAACDYLAIGSDQDYLYIPLTPYTAQFLADTLNCTLPTKKLVDRLYANADVSLAPQPIPPSDQMTTLEVFWQHTDSIKQQLSHGGIDRSATALWAGHKKDLIISNAIYDPERPGERVVIYGWHLSENNPIQGVYNGHIASYADYSHGVRFISRSVFLNGDSICLEDILKDPVLWPLISDEGVINKPYYPGRKAVAYSRRE